MKEARAHHNMSRPSLTRGARIETLVDVQDFPGDTVAPRSREGRGLKLIYKRNAGERNGRPPLTRGARG